MTLKDKLNQLESKVDVISSSTNIKLDYIINQINAVQSGLNNIQNSTEIIKNGVSDMTLAVLNTQLLLDV